MTEIGQEILATIKSSKRILLHCHPRPDQDSVSSVLAMRLALQQLGKEVVAIRGDNPLPKHLVGLLGYETIESKNYFEVDLSQFDLFIILDSGDLTRISELAAVKFPNSLLTVVIDHHATTPHFGTINLIVPEAAATSEILAGLFERWKLTITPDMALCLFSGLWGDTGGFRYSNVTAKTLMLAGRLVAAIGQPRVSNFISELESSNELGRIKFEGLALSQPEILFNGEALLSVVTLADLEKAGLGPVDASGSAIANILKSVKNCLVGVLLLQEEAGKFKTSFRSRDGEKYDVSKVAVLLGGGGHQAAAGALFSVGTVDEARAKVITALDAIFHWSTI